MDRGNGAAGPLLIIAVFRKDTNQSCLLSGTHCHVTLVISPTLQCSASCGQGYRQRLVSCSEVHVENENYEYGHQSLSNCPGTPPESYMSCSLDPCPPPQAWRVGTWGPVSEPLAVTAALMLPGWIRTGVEFGYSDRWFGLGCF